MILYHNQWGYDTDGNNSCTFPTSFTSACYAIVCTENGDGGFRGGVRIFAIPNGKTGFTCKFCMSNDSELYNNWNRGDSSKAMKVGWIAIGK